MFRKFLEIVRLTTWELTALGKGDSPLLQLYPSLQKELNCYKSPNAFPQRRQWHPTPVLLHGKSHGFSLVGCSTWGCEESDTTEAT